jgi:hypothetical protein
LPAILVCKFGERELNATAKVWFEEELFVHDLFACSFIPIFVVHLALATIKSCRLLQRNYLRYLKI